MYGYIIFHSSFQKTRETMGFEIITSNQFLIVSTDSIVNVYTSLVGASKKFGAESMHAIKVKMYITKPTTKSMICVSTSSPKFLLSNRFMRVMRPSAESFSSCPPLFSLPKPRNEKINNRYC